MNITYFFERLGAPLKNSRWSWGAIRPSDGSVFLRVWQDENLVEQGRTYISVAWNARPKRTDLGFRERLSHVARIREGAPCYLVVCRAKDPRASPRKIERFDRNFVFKGGTLVERNGRTYIEVGTKFAVAELTT